jgi:hypothetical protein
MSNIIDFHIGDKIYKKSGNMTNNNTVYEIKELWEEESGNRHDGYRKVVFVKLEGESDPYLLVNHIYGNGICIYGVKVFMK